MTKFSDTTNRDGLIELIERNTSTQSSTTSSYPLKVKTSDVNDALGHFMLLAIKAGGRFQVDDTNHSELPVVSADIVSGQQDYAFLVDDESTPNQILDVRKVRITDANGNKKTLTQIDRETFDIDAYEWVTGTPEYFDVMGNSLVFYPTFNYSSDYDDVTETGGMEIYVSRTPQYFVSTDTTKEAGIPKIFHRYLHIRPSYFFSMVNDLPQAKGLKLELDELEKQISAYYTRRNKTERQRFTFRQGGVDSNK